MNNNNNKIIPGGSAKICGIDMTLALGHRMLSNGFPCFWHQTRDGQLSPHGKIRPTAKSCPPRLSLQ